MANLTHSESRRLYSRWWDSHNTPKNSKWLQQNITDIDDKVKCMIKLIEEDADSFTRRAEMYYKKRPELMKMVEEHWLKDITMQRGSSAMLIERYQVRFLTKCLLTLLKIRLHQNQTKAMLIYFILVLHYYLF